MSPRDVVLSLYAAYRTRDPGQIAQWLHPDVRWIAPPGNATQVALGLGGPDVSGVPDGSNDLDRAAIVSFMADDFRRMYPEVAIEVRAMDAIGERVYSEHRMTATLVDGRPLVLDYCFVYEIRDDRVWRIREYMDTRGGWIQVFGDRSVDRMVALLGRPPQAP